MKRIFIFLSLTISALLIYANNTQVVVVHPKGGSHFDWPVPADQPDVYYDDDEQEIIIDGTGYVSYYDVEITSTTSWMVYVTTQVNSA